MVRGPHPPARRQPRIEYNTLGSEVTIRFPLLADLSVSDRRWLLWDLLKMFDPGLEGDPAEYEAYQKACEVVLERAGKVD